MQRAERVAARDRRVGGVGRATRALDVERDDGVQRRIEALDACQIVLEQLAARKGETLNYSSSIVDLMKLLDLDSSLDNRKELATELGYTGAKDGSAEMNTWLHKRVMQELEKNGGKVSAELRD